MFENLQRTMTTYRAEVLTAEYLLLGRFIPFGGAFAFLNDRTRRFAQFEDAEVIPLLADRHMGSIKREAMTVNMSLFVLLSFLDKEEIRDIQVMPSFRPVVFYMNQCAVQGKLHINADAKDTDMLDDTRDFFAVTDASIFPMRPMALQPTRQIPLCFVNMHYIYAYHRHTG